MKLAHIENGDLLKIRQLLFSINDIGQILISLKLTDYERKAFNHKLKDALIDFDELLIRIEEENKPNNAS